MRKATVFIHLCTLAALALSACAFAESAPDQQWNSLRYDQPFSVQYVIREVRGIVPATKMRCADLIDTDETWTYVQDGKGNFLLRGKLAKDSALEIFPTNTDSFAIIGSRDTGFVYCQINAEDLVVRAEAIPEGSSILAYDWLKFSYPELTGLNAPNMSGTGLFRSDYGVTPYKARRVTLSTETIASGTEWEWRPVDPMDTVFNISLDQGIEPNWPFTFPTVLRNDASPYGFDKELRAKGVQSFDNGLQFPTEGEFVIRRAEGEDWVEHTYLHYEVLDLRPMSGDELTSALRLPTVEGRFLYSTLPEDVTAGTQRIPLPAYITPSIWVQMHLHRLGADLTADKAT